MSVTSSADWPFDGRLNGYLPRKTLTVDASLRLHDEAADTIDPITFEIIRSHLWTINLEHGDTIQRASGSPTVIYANDFNQSIHCEDGTPVVLGPSMLHFTGLADLAIRWTLENRSASPGIKPGDVFLHNDPWVGAAHQQDSSVYAPIFYDGALFGWVLNTCHERDIGGVEPGSFVPQAKDVFWEPTPVPPIKIGQNDVILSDVEDMFVRKSRLPGLCTLEIRSQFAGVLAAKRRLEELIAKHGAPVVKAVMNKIVDDCERAVRHRLARLPDGQWTSRVYYTGSEFGDRALRTQVLTMTKTGTSLSWSNLGTDPQMGQVNVTTGTWRANITAVVLNHLAYDQFLCAGGVLRVLQFDPEPGLRTSCQWPSAVTGSANPARATAAQANHVVSMMMSCDPEQNLHVWSAEGIHTMVNAVFHGTRKDGRQFAGSPTDMLAGATGARTFSDGISAGGRTLAPLSHTADVEVWEQGLGILYLYRRIQPIGGHGLFTGGAAIVSAFLGHEVQTQFANSNTAGNGLPTGPGLWGAYPAPGGGLYCAQDTGIRAAFALRRLPAGPQALREAVPSLRHAQPKEVHIPFGEDDVWEIAYASAAGYGDPLERNPASVAEDVSHGRITPAAAANIYGVIIDARGAIDARTEGRRSSIRRARLAQGRYSTGPWEQRTDVRAAAAAHEMGCALDVAAVAPGFFRCRICRWVVSAIDVNYKEHVLYLDVQLPDLDSSLFVDPAEQVDELVICRIYACPGCGRLFDTEICRPGDPPTWDVRLSPKEVTTADE